MFDLNKKKSKTSMVGFRATQEERDLLDDLAEEQDLTLSDLMRKITKEYVKSYKKEV